ncbi:MAG: hypothetical protein M1431_00720 [Candidatus Thermoplasmatota archaeon]|nr:hypothetical protein [Candidatus Thermoplasmatota archaeon]
MTDIKDKDSNIGEQDFRLALAVTTEMRKEILARLRHSSGLSLEILIFQ